MIKLATLTILLALSACSSTSSNLAVTEHSAQPQCAGISSGLTQLTPQTLQRLQQRQFLIEGSNDPAAGAPVAQELLIAVSHGAQPSPGYRFELRSATLSEGVAQLNLHWTTPPTNSIQATVMTNPCLVLALPKGDYQRVVAQDQNGAIGSLDLAP
jgi:hypothetical protein